ncbi:hypothetical protein COLO4_35697 [Corchorus olitorius]|uniref:non-specific serine/threonine protein kinase n=1 Tax=Corchorus olitorius TaxID=93759 RepID=A0A1R3GDY6_9ROSI|nr:hypothetical protein COLO4_35697 [Corchorus olitorius]
MDAFFFFLSPSFFSLFFLLVASAEDDVHFASCAPFDCGNLKNISYPFWTDHHGRPAYCGFDYEGYKLKYCMENQFPVLTISSQEFRLLHLNQSRGLMTIQRLEFGENTTCPQEIFMDNKLNYPDTSVNIALSRGCRSLSANYSLKCKWLGTELIPLFFNKNDENQVGCVKQVEVPVEKKALDELMLGNFTLNQTLVQPFDMKYFAYDDYCRRCKQSGGRCGSDAIQPPVFVCYCPDHPHSITCKHGKSSASICSPNLP